jgi:glutathione synthase/RimK-type ligase-like ATP-grasp enzyme
MKKNNVLLFSTETDVHADRLESVNDSSVKFVRLNLDKPKTWGLSFQHGDVVVDTYGHTFGIDEIQSVFVRRVPNVDSFIKAVEPAYVDYAPYIANQEFALFSDCLAILDTYVPFVNPLATASKAGKAIQAKVASDVGFITPETYIGSNPRVARKFCEDLIAAQREVCTKPISNSKVTIDGEQKTRFTEKLNHDALAEMDSLTHCPIIFQGYIEKSYEIRATVIGSTIYAAKIESQVAGGQTAVDWRRYNIPKTPHSPYKFPLSIEQKIFDLHDRLGLIYSSFDFIRTPSGEYVFLETNPFGQWLWIEDLTGLEISKGIAQYLASPRA